MILTLWSLKFCYRQPLRNEDVKEFRFFTFKFICVCLISGTVKDGNNLY